MFIVGNSLSDIRSTLPSSITCLHRFPSDLLVTNHANVNKRTVKPLHIIAIYNVCEVVQENYKICNFHVLTIATPTAILYYTQLL